MALTKKGKIGIGIGVSIFVLLAIGGLMLYLFVAGAFGRSVVSWKCDYKTVANVIDLQPKLIREDGLYECFPNYKGELTVIAGGIVDNKKLLKGKEKMVGFYFGGSTGGIYGWAVERDRLEESFYHKPPMHTMGEEASMTENTGVKSTWGADIYYLPDRELYLDHYCEVLYCDYIVDDNTFYRYMFSPGETSDGKEMDKDTAIKTFNKIFVF